MSYTELEQRDHEWAAMIWHAIGKVMANGCCINEATPKELWQACDNVQRAVANKLGIYGGWEDPAKLATYERVREIERSLADKEV